MSYEDDIVNFLKLISNLDVRTGGDSSAVSCIDGIEFICKTPVQDFTGIEPYWFRINGIDWRQYENHVRNAFTLFEKKLQQDEMRRRLYHDFVIDYINIHKVLKDALAVINSIDFSRYSNQASQKYRASYYDEDLDEVYDRDVTIPPHTAIEDYRKLHIDCINKALNLLGSFQTQTSLIGVHIKEQCRGVENANLKQLFNELTGMTGSKLDVKQETNFINAFTGGPMDSEIYWPKKALVSRFIEGLWAEGLLVDSVPEANIPWKMLSKLFRDDNGPYNASIRGNSKSKPYSNDKRLKKVLSNLKNALTPS